MAVAINRFLYHKNCRKLPEEHSFEDITDVSAKGFAEGHNLWFDCGCAWQPRGSIAERRAFQVVSAEAVEKLGVLDIL